MHNKHSEIKNDFNDDTFNPALGSSRLETDSNLPEYAYGIKES